MARSHALAISARRWAAAGGRLDLVHLALLAFLLAVLGLFILVPILKVMLVAFSEGGRFTLVHFLNFFERPLFRESFYNSLLAATLAVVFGTLIGLPLAYIGARLDFRGKILVQTLGVLPLMIPPFVGAVALQLLLGRGGTLNLLLQEWFGVTVPLMEGLTGVIFVQSIHYFPFILMNSTAALANIDPSMEEAAQNLGSRGFRLFRRVTLPLMAPGYVAGALLVFIKVFDDLATPLLLDFTNMLAPQAYLRITNIGIDDPAGYVISVIMVALSLAALVLVKRGLALTEYATAERGASGATLVRPLRGWRGGAVVAFLVVIFLVTLAPHIGILILSFSRVWSYSLLPTAYTLRNYGEIFLETPHFVTNTVFYCVLAAGLCVVLGSTISYLLLRSRVVGRGLLDLVATLPLAVPGVVLAVGYLRLFHAYPLPFLGLPLTALWPILVIAYTMRRLPYALRASYAALQQVHISLEEASQSLGARRLRTALRVTLPLMAGGLIAGWLSAFLTASVELSATILLVPKMDFAPLSYGIYIYMQSAVGRGPGAALGVVSILLVMAGTFLIHRLFAGGRESLFRF